LPEKVSILAVLVLYRHSIEESVTWKALLGQVNGKLNETVDFHLLVCDNGPFSYSHEVPLLPEWVDYVGVHDNHGLAWAYNLGLALARERAVEWMLTLDQDTALPPDFLARMAKLAKQEDSEAATAIVPQLVSEHGHVYSPVIAGINGERTVPLGFRGFAAGDVRPYNSAAMVRTAALTAVGGYDRRFWMNYLDHSIFYALQKAGHRIRIAGEVQVQHHLSLHEGRDRMSEQHFKHFSVAESAFRDLHASRIEGWLFTTRLLLRAINQKRRRDPAHFFRATLAVLKSRLFVGRRERLRRWEADVAPLAADPLIVFQGRGTAVRAEAKGAAPPGAAQ
jgi:GT2 family glycosyltransferase